MPRNQRRPHHRINVLAVGLFRRLPRLGAFTLVGLAVIVTPICLSAQEAPVATSNAAAYLDPEGKQNAAGIVELLSLVGVREDDWDVTLTGLPDSDQLAIIGRILDAFRRIPISRREKWAELPPSTQPDLKRGAIYELRGTAISLSKFPLDAETAQEFGIESLFRVTVRPASEFSRTAVIYAAHVPKSWPEGDLNEMISALAIAFAPESRADVAGEDDRRPVFLTERLAWHPDMPLGRLGLDVGLLDTLRGKASLGPDEGECFYQALAAAKSVGTAWSPPEKEMPFSVVPFFNDPGKHRGDWVVLEGNARRVVRVLVEREIADRLEFDHYWEVDLVTPDSQGNPLVLCVTELPDGLNVGESVDEPIRFGGFFLKSWAYRSGKDGPRESQLAPLFVGRTVELRPDAAARDVSVVHTWIVLGLLVGTVAFLVTLGAYPRKIRREVIPPPR